MPKKPKDGDAVVFRSWSSDASSPEITKLDQDLDKARRQLHELREHGRQIRLHRLEGLDALETRRVTLTEILRRMEKELNEEDVYKYWEWKEKKQEQKLLQKR